jgi:hypothetical protein
MRLCLLPALLSGLVFVPVQSGDKPPRADPKAPALDLCLEIQALRTLYLLRVTVDQARAMEGIAKKIVAPDRDREKPRLSDAYRRILAGLHDALAADDEDKVDDLEDQLTELTDSEEPELDDAVHVTAAARRRVPEVLRNLRPQQIASYLGSIAEEVGDPQQRLVTALEQIRSDKNDDWEAMRDELGDDLSWLLGGLDVARRKAVRDEVASLLTKSRNLNSDAFDKQKPDLDKAARAIGAGVEPIDVLRHAVERALARLLSNPRLVEALQARLKAAK